MNAIENDVRALVDKELAAANERFPQFHSEHEGWAVLKEEVEELEEEIGHIETQLSYMWDKIRNDWDPSPHVISVFKRSISAACEAIQVAAMCQKFMGMEEQK